MDVIGHHYKLVQFDAWKSLWEVLPYLDKASVELGVFKKECALSSTERDKIGTSRAVIIGWQSRGLPVWAIYSMFLSIHHWFSLHRPMRRWGC